MFGPQLCEPLTRSCYLGTAWCCARLFFSRLEEWMCLLTLSKEAFLLLEGYVARRGVQGQEGMHRFLTSPWCSQISQPFPVQKLGCSSTHSPTCFHPYCLQLQLGTVWKCQRMWEKAEWLPPHLPSHSQKAAGDTEKPHQNETKRNKTKQANKHVKTMNLWHISIQWLILTLPLKEEHPPLAENAISLNDYFPFLPWKYKFLLHI